MRSTNCAESIISIRLIRSLRPKSSKVKLKDSQSKIMSLSRRLRSSRKI